MSTQTKIAVLSGGTSDEREVSLRSGAAVSAALQDAGYETVLLDPSHPDAEFEAEINTCAAVFPALHGRGGEDGSIQAWLEARDIVFVGADSVVSQLCFDKWHYKQTLLGASVPTPAGELVDDAAFSASSLIRQPYVLKPFDGGSSVDTFIIRDPSQADRAAITAAFMRHPHMLLEQLIKGTEITVAVLGDEVLPVIEIVPPADGEFDYENKYNGRTQELCPPQSVSQELQAQAQKLALQIHQQLKVRDLSRTDIMISQVGELFVLETNTIPGMTNQSLLPKAAAEAGYTMPQLTARLVESALARASS
jgi:D-alanine-D-alanine ligase